MKALKTFWGTTEKCENKFLFFSFNRVILPLVNHEIKNWADFLIHQLFLFPFSDN